MATFSGTWFKSFSLGLLLVIASFDSFACPDGYSRNFLGMCMPNIGSGGAIDPGRIQREILVEQYAPILKNLIIASRQEAFRRPNYPLPPAIVQEFTGFYAPNVLGVKWGVGGGNDLSLQAGSFRFGDRAAIVLDTILVFRSPSDAAVTEQNLWLWAHELAHVEQYRAWGIDDFTKRYIRDYNAVERQANERADQFLAWRQQRNSAPAPQSWPMPQPANGTVCVTPRISCPWFGPIGWNCSCASPWGLQAGTIR